MLKFIIGKEIHDNLLNTRFVVSSVVSIVLIISSIVVLSANYESEVRDYQNRVRTQEDFIDNYGHANRAGWMGRQMMPPSPFHVLVLGIDREADQANFMSNPLSALLLKLDFVTIVTIIMSLMALLFSYNAISGEREAGILRQMLSNGVSRGTILLGKFIGGNASLLIPFTAGVLMGLIYLAVGARVQFDSADYIAVAMLLAVSWLYISAFFALGLLFSARSQSSNEAILKSLFTWVLLILALPNISPFLAAQIYRIPSAARIEQESYRIQDTERDQIFAERVRKLQQTSYSDIAGAFGLSRSELEKKLQSDAAFQERYRAYSKDAEALINQVNAEQREKANKISAEFEDRAAYQQSLASVLASSSPLADFTFFATEMTETGIGGEEHWRRQANEYEGAFARFVDSRYQKAKDQNPAFSSNEYLDLRDRPRFHYRAGSLSERLDPVLPQVGLIVFFNILFFAVAFVSFLRYDVR